jgi:tetratricopeptide (TPR) repeat protein
MLDSGSKRQSLLALSLLLTALTLAAYWQVQHNDFVNYDDYRYVLENRHVLAGLTWEGFYWAFHNLEAGFWQPLTWLSHMLDSELFGPFPKGHHWSSLLLHLANGLVLFLLLHRMTGALWRSWLVATLFAVHPLHVESVAWVSQRKDVLSTLLWLGTIWGYFLYQRRPRTSTYLLVLMLFVSGLMAKAMLVSLPIVLLLLDYWPIGQLRSTSSPDSAASSLFAAKAQSVPSFSASRLILEKLPLFAIAAFFVLVTYVAERHVGAVSPESLPLKVRIANALVSYVVYIRQMFWPLDLSPLYLHPGKFPLWHLVGVCLVLIAISGVTIWLARRRPYLIVGWLWFLVTLMPVSGLIQIGSHAHADRYTYVPFIGLFIMLVWGARDGLPRGNIVRIGFVSSVALVLMLLTIGTSLQVRHWRNSEALFSRAVAVDPDNFLAHNHLGYVLALEGRLGEAIGHYRTSLRINPNYDSAHYHLANTLTLVGETEGAIHHYGRVLQIRPQYARPYARLGDLYQKLGKTGEAIRLYRASLQIEPADAELHKKLGRLLVAEGLIGEAIKELEAALRINPHDNHVIRELEGLRRDWAALGEETP